MSSDPNWTKTGIHYLVIGHACDEEQECHVMFFYDEQPRDYIEKKFTEKVKEDLDSWEKDKEIYIDFILKSISPIHVDYD
jgi:hypothetical protein